MKELIEGYATAHGNINQKHSNELSQEYFSKQTSSRPREKEPLEDVLPLESSRRMPYHTWNGGFHALPQDFEFPDSTQIWLAWWIGDPDNGIPPDRVMSGNDISSGKHRRRFCLIYVY